MCAVLPDSDRGTDSNVSPTLSRLGGKPGWDEVPKEVVVVCPPRANSVDTLAAADAAPDGWPPASEDQLGRPRVTWFLVSACLLLSAIAVVVAVVVTRGSATSAPTGSATHGPTRHSLANTQWRMTAVRSDGKTVSIPSGVNDVLAFRDGAFSAYDTVNRSGGHYSMLAGNLVTVGLFSTYVGYGGGDPIRDALVRAIDQIADQPKQLSMVRFAGESRMTLITGAYTTTWVLVGTT